MKVHRNPLLKNDMSSWWSLESTANLDVCLVPPDLQKPLPGALNNNYIVLMDGCLVITTIFFM